MTKEMKDKDSYEKPAHNGPKDGKKSRIKPKMPKGGKK
jgi:hypothetical protein